MEACKTPETKRISKCPGAPMRHRSRLTKSTITTKTVDSESTIRIETVVPYTKCRRSLFSTAYHSS